MKRLSSMVLAAGVAACVAGVAGLAAGAWVNLPPRAIRGIAMTLPFVLGGTLLLVGALIGRVSRRAELRGAQAARASLGAGAAAGAPRPEAHARDRSEGHPRGGSAGRRALGLLAVLLGACANPQPPAEPPDFEGVIVGRTPRLESPPAAARLIVQEPPLTPFGGSEAPPPALVDVELAPGVRTMESVPDGAYRWAESSDAWVGRSVRVWFDSGGGLSRDSMGRAVSRRARAVVSEIR